MKYIVHSSKNQNDSKLFLTYFVASLPKRMSDEAGWNVAHSFRQTRSKVSLTLTIIWIFSEILYGLIKIQEQSWNRGRF